MIETGSHDIEAGLVVALASLPFVGHSTPLSFIGRQLLEESIHVQFLISKFDAKADKLKAALTNNSRVQFEVIDDGIEAKLRFTSTLPPDDCCNDALPAWTEAIKKLEPKPNLLIADAHTCHAAVAANALGIPFALNYPDSLSLVFLMSDSVVPQSFSELLVTLFLNQRRNFYTTVFSKARFHLVNSFRDWEGDQRPWPENIFEVGPQGPRKEEQTCGLLNSFRFLFDDTNLPVVYISTGSNFILSKKEMRRLYFGLSKVPNVRFIWALSANLRDSLKEVDEDRFHIVDWAPQKQILAHPLTKAVVYHGGFNGVCEAMQGGKPMLLFPMGADQLTNADNAASHGVGFQINRHRFTSDEVSGKLQRLLSEPCFTEAATRMQQSIMRTGGVLRSVEVIKESLLGRVFQGSELNCEAPKWSALQGFLRNRGVRLSCERRARPTAKQSR